MVHPGITFAVVLGVAVGTALYFLFSQENTQRQHSYQRQDTYHEPEPTPWIPARSSSRASQNTSGTPQGRRRRRNSSSQCSICQEAIRGTNCKVLTCGHEFHSNCLNAWLRQQKTCPNCRSPVWL